MISHKTSLQLFLIIILLFTLRLSSQSQPQKIYLSSNWNFRQADSGRYLPATVPGCVHTDLMVNKLIEDPFWGTNEKMVQWVDKKDWEYQTTFTLTNDILAKQNLELVFDGLDTYAEVWLNDKLILKADNMFRQWRVDCKPWLTESNTLKVRFLSPIRIGLEKLEANGYALPNDNDDSKTGGIGDKKVSVFTRKMQCQYGWDWGPRLITSGIWRPVYLEAWDNARIADVQLVSKAVSEKSAQLTSKIEIESNNAQAAKVYVKMDGEPMAQKEVHLNKGNNLVILDIDIKNPKLWWSNGLGEAYCYKTQVYIETSTSTDYKNINYGIRTLKLIQKPDTAGKSFYFELNGIPVFAKGANYIPSDAFVTRVTPEKYERLISDAANTNMNMLRVWGGGFYENDLFYDLCDKYGIMVWQDFMFACSLYPGDEAFMENVKQEAIYNVKRLRNHACIALWCGNNECQAAWKDWGYEKKFVAKDPKLAEKVWGDYCNLFHHLLYTVVSEYHTEADYWASSPMSSWTPGLNDDKVAQRTDKSGDRHYWDVWHGSQPFSKYVELIPRFMSEYGFQSFPEFKTVKTYAPKSSDWSIESEIMMHHQKNGRGNMLIRKYMEEWYKVPAAFENFLYVSSLLQAEGIKTGMEAHRRNMPYCMGSLYWQLNDCWPVASWSSMDYYLRWKALQFYAKKSYAPLLVSPVMDNGNVKVYIVSDELKTREVSLDIKVVGFGGEILFQGLKNVRLEPNSSKVYFEAELKDVVKERNFKNAVLSVSIQSNGKVVSENLLYFLPYKDLVLPEPEIKSTFTKTENGYLITLKTDKLAKNVFLDFDGSDYTFNDNYFDMMPGSVKYILLKTKTDIANPEQKLKVLTLDQTLN